MKCNKCGNDVPNSAKFCAFCGARIEAPPEKTNPNFERFRTSPKAPIKPKISSKKKRIIIILSVVFGLIVISSIGHMLFGGNSSSNYNSDITYEETKDVLDEYLDNAGDEDYTKNY